MNADAMAYLRDKGLSFDEAIEFARLSERRPDPTNAARQARHRAKSNAVTVTRDPPKERDQTPADISNEIPARPRKRAAPAEVEIPQWVPAKPWADFVAMRVEIKKPVTPGGITKLIEKLSEISQSGWDIGKVLDKSTVNLWRGLFMPTPGRDDDMRVRPAGKPGADMTELDRLKVALFSDHRNGVFDEPEYRRRKAELEQQFAQPPPERRNGGSHSIGALVSKFSPPPQQDSPQ